MRGAGRCIKDVQGGVEQPLSVSRAVQRLRLTARRELALGDERWLEELRTEYDERRWGSCGGRSWPQIL